MAARADFVVETAVDFILFGTENRGEIVGHDRDLDFCFGS